MLCTKAKVAKGGDVFVGHYGTCNAKCRNTVLNLLLTVYATILVTVALLYCRLVSITDLISNRTISQFFSSCTYRVDKQLGVSYTYIALPLAIVLGGITLTIEHFIPWTTEVSVSKFHTGSMVFGFPSYM